MLAAGQQERRLTFGGRPLSIALRPQLVSRATWEAVVQASQTTYAALQALERALLADRGLRAELDLEPEEERLALADPHCRSSSSSSRLDGFLSGRLRYVEYNAESPAGMAYGDTLTAVFDTLPVVRQFRKRFKLRSVPLRSRQLASMLRAFRSAANGSRPVIAIVDWPGLPTSTEFEMFRDFFESRGIRTVICDPRELELRRGRLYAGGKLVNLVYRRVLTSELLAKGEETRALRDAYLQGTVCVVNSFRAKLLHKKMSLALLSDDHYARLYTAEQRRVIARHVPWTRKVRQGPTTRAGRPVPDLVAYIADHQGELVLKPNDEYGGKGVALGWTVSRAEWESVLRTALEESFVVQEAVPVPRQEFPVMLDGRVQSLDLAMDMDPYLFDGRVAGCLARLSSSALLNVTAGAGSIVPTYIVEPAA
jgi:uncharacterized circularly permuted ATP-grasp superfamily protein